MLEDYFTADILNEAVSWRHDLHRRSELAYCERRPADRCSLARG